MTRRPKVAAAIQARALPTARPIALAEPEEWYALSSALARRRLIDRDADLEEVAADLDLDQETAEALLAPLQAHFDARRAAVQQGRACDPASLLPLVAERTALARADALGRAIYNRTQNDRAWRDLTERVVHEYASAANTDRQVLIPSQVDKNSGDYHRMIGCCQDIRRFVAELGIEDLAVRAVGFDSSEEGKGRVEALECKLGVGKEPRRRILKPHNADCTGARRQVGIEVVRRAAKGGWNVDGPFDAVVRMAALVLPWRLVRSRSQAA